MTDSAAVRELAGKYEKDMVEFLRELIRIPSESSGEGPVIERIKAELEKMDAYDEIRIDKMGNLLARYGNGPRLIAIDAHVDTVGIGDPAEWAHDPYEGKVEDGFIYGRGAGDQEGAVPPMVYAGRIMKDLGIRSEDWTLLLTFTVSEEDCDGLNWQYLVQEENIRPECVVVTDSTNCKILRGHRGRMEIHVTTKGRSCHGSMPHKGDNAVYKIAKIINEIEKLNDNLKHDDFLGKGTITVSYVDCKTPSMCAVPDQAFIHVDRRVTSGEDRESALAEVREAVARAGVEAEVKLNVYERPTWTGLSYPTDAYFPTWVFDEDSPHVKAAADNYRNLFDREPTVSCWTFSTNGVSIAGLFGIPCVGFGPAEEDVAHTVNDRVPIEHLTMCAAFYATYAETYCAANPEPVSAQKQTATV